MSDKFLQGQWKVAQGYDKWKGSENWRLVCSVILLNEIEKEVLWKCKEYK